MTDPLGLIGSSTPMPPPVAPSGGPGTAGPDFKKVLLENIEKVNQLQQEAQAAAEDFATGRRDDVANVMIAKQKADLAFKTLMQVRNKLVDAYEEVKQMRV